jgi:hypothetical protein
VIRLQLRPTGIKSSGESGDHSSRHSWTLSKFLEMPSEANPLRVALLVNDTPVKPVIDEFGAYPEIYHRWLESCRPTKDAAFTLDPFDVVNHPGNYPNPEDYDAMILTGSGLCHSMTVGYMTHQISLHQLRLPTLRYHGLNNSRSM